MLNFVIEEALQAANIQLLDLTHLSELRADAHPAIWLGRKDAVSRVVNAHRRILRPLPFRFRKLGDKYT